MRFMPVFLDLAAGEVILAGSGELAESKLRLLLSANARVRWHGGTERDLDAMKIVAPDERGRIDLVPGDGADASLEGVVAIVCAGAGAAGETLAHRARAAGIPVNVLDDLVHSTFIFPAIVDRGDVVVAIGTGGSAPVLARRLRERIEALLPDRIGELASFIGSWRKAVHARLPEMPLKRRFWEKVVDGEIGARVLAGDVAGATVMLDDIADPVAFVGEAAVGTVALVGAGPGDPDLLTVKALRVLQDADLILHDDLVSPQILDRARREAVRVPVGRRRGQPGVGQEEIHRLMIEAAREGKRVVRLKGGDPFVFGRGGEEVAALREAGVNFTIVPGITSALGAAAESELPLTFRQEALRVAFVTAHRADEVQSIDWSGFADAQTTLVIYMGVASAPAVQQSLIAAGRDQNAPAAIFINATREDSRAVVGTIADLGSLAAEAGEQPALIVVGDVVRHSRPGRKAGLTRFFRQFTVAA